MRYDISVVLATFNRAKDLHRTLEGMAKTRKGGMTVGFVVVDNGSTDRTRAVVQSFSGRMPIQYIYEARSGKNRALNTALEKAELADIVVFTDDDVDVPAGWLTAIRSVCNRWPDHSVFGGRIDVVFPNAEVPKWAFDPDISSFAFARHNYSRKECVYGKGETPFGPNLWVRRSIFDGNRRFNEAIGPRPGNRIMGSETSFLVGLLNEGYEIVYSPAVAVGHRIQPEALKWQTVCTRAYRLGRSVPYIHGLPQASLLGSYPALWRMYRYSAIAWNASRVLSSALFSRKEKRLVNCARSIRNIGYHRESMRFRIPYYRDDRC
ncbi:MAG TPA: glycosyltransferase [Dissulfurispiraceae bacterium]